MTRIKLLALGAMTTLMILGSSLVIAAQPTDDEAGSGGPVIGGGLGRSLKR